MSAQRSACRQDCVNSVLFIIHPASARLKEQMMELTGPLLIVQCVVSLV